MAISVAQSVSFIGSSATTTFTLSSLSTTAGSLFVVAIAIRDTTTVSSVTDSGSNTWTARAYLGTTWSGSAIWTTNVVSPAAITSVTVTMSGSTYVNFKFYEVNGAVNNAIDVSSTGHNATAGSASSGTTSTPTGSTATYTSTTFTSGTGTLFTLNQNTGGAIVDQVTGYLVLSSATGQAFSATSSANYYANSCIILIKAAPAKPSLGLLGVG